MLTGFLYIEKKQEYIAHDEGENQQIRNKQRHYTADKMVDMKQFL